MPMKTYPLFKKTFLMLTITVLFVGLALFLMCINIFLFNEWDWRQPLIIGAWLISSIVLFILTPLNVYYEVNKKYVMVIKYRKKTIYNFADVVYIDEEKSEKHKSVHFFTWRIIQKSNFDKINVAFLKFFVIKFFGMK